MIQIVESLWQSASFQPGQRVQTLRGSARGVILRILEDGRIVWRPDGTEAEISALTESLKPDNAP